MLPLWHPLVPGVLKLLCSGNLPAAAEHLIPAFGDKTLAMLLTPLIILRGSREKTLTVTTGFPSAVPGEGPHLSLHHSSEHGTEVLQVGSLQLGHDARVQQHQAQGVQRRPQLQHQRVTHIHCCHLLRARPALDQDVPGVQVGVHEVVDKDLEDR